MSISKTFIIASTTLAACLILVAISAELVSKIPEPTAPQAPPTVVSDLTVDKLLQEVNQERTKVGAQPLVLDPLLIKSAQLKADEIEQTGVFEHAGTTGKHGLAYIQDLGVQGCRYIAENLAADTTSKGAVVDWLESKPHRDAMLDDRYDTTGFGISSGPGYQYIVEHFCDLP